MKNSNDTIGNRTRDLPACSVVPQPIAPPRAPRVAPSTSFRLAKAGRAALTDTVLSVAGIMESLGL